MKLFCTYFAAGTRYHWGQEVRFHRIFNVTHDLYVDAVWASNYIQEQLEKKGGEVVFTQFNLVGAAQEVDNDFEV